MEASPWLEDNQWILDLARDNRIILGFVGSLDVKDSGFAANLARFSKNPLFRGIRLSGTTIRSALLSQPAFASLERLSAADLSLDALGDATMLGPVASLAERLPRLRIVIDHLPFDGDLGESLKRLREKTNVFAKVSNVPRRVDGVVREDLAYYRAKLDELWDAFGPDRVIYGSNWPVSNNVAPYAVAWKLVREYFQARGSEASEKYFQRNSKAAYKWIER